MNRYFFYYLCGLFVSVSAFAEEKLIFAVDIIRHGDRTPLIATSVENKFGVTGLGQLTPIGMRQEYNLGKKLRHLYVDKYQLLPTNYDISSMIVRSSGIPRTLMSTQAILLGLYPLGTGPLLSSQKNALPKGFQPIPINTVPPKQDSLLIPDSDQEKFAELLKKYIFNSQDWIKYDTELSDNYSKWSTIFNIKISSLVDLIKLSDLLYIYKLYDVSLPSGLDDKDANLILEAGKWAWLFIANNKNLALDLGRELAEKIKQEIVVAAQNSTALKYMLFVAHDSTIQAQLRILGKSFNYMPPYSANLNYSLFLTDTSKYEVRITYNDKLLKIKKCGSKACSLDEFVRLI